MNKRRNMSNHKTVYNIINTNNIIVQNYMWRLIFYGFIRKWLIGRKMTLYLFWSHIQMEILSLHFNLSKHICRSSLEKMNTSSWSITKLHVTDQEEVFIFSSEDLQMCLENEYFFLIYNKITCYISMPHKLDLFKNLMENQRTFIAPNINVFFE